MQVQIEHPETGERFEVSLDAFESAPVYPSRKTGKLITYKGAGFRVVANADGTEYHPAPKPPEPEPSKPAAKPAKKGG
jgi:hypothetical protein